MQWPSVPTPSNWPRHLTVRESKPLPSRRGTPSGISRRQVCLRLGFGPKHEPNALASGELRLNDRVLRESEASAYGS